MKNAEDFINSDRGSPDMKDVVTLATSLVSAQIVASTYHETAMNSLQEFRRVILDAIGSEGEALSNRGLSFDIRPKVNVNRRKMRKVPLLEPVSQPRLDELFQSAMRRAFDMLNSPFDSDRIVLAEQIFKHDEILPEGGIRKRFSEYQWIGLKSGDGVTRLMRDVRQWFVSHANDAAPTSHSAAESPPTSVTDSRTSVKDR